MWDGTALPYLVCDTGIRETVGWGAGETDFSFETKSHAIAMYYCNGKIYKNKNNKTNNRAKFTFKIFLEKKFSEETEILSIS